jgi:outer membrane protein assembly factor BamB
VTGQLNASPVIANGLILVAAFQGDNLLTAFDSTGTQKWTFNPPKK